MLTAVTLAIRPDFRISQWTCRGDQAAWSEPESPVDARLVLVRAGRFQRRGFDGPLDLDPTVGYVAAPGESEHFAHPHGGDRCTSVQLSAQSWWQLVGEPGRVRRSAVYVDAELELAHRRLLAAGHHDPDYRLAEDVLQLAVLALRGSGDRPTPMDDAPSPADRRLVAMARAALHDGHPSACGLFPLASLLGASPYRLSRAFTRELGVSVTRYRNRIRIGRALDQLERGERGLADLAAELGFADQAHFSRTLRQHTGHTPTAVRRMLHRSVPQ
ncbi:helix-turn-helix domain-containing protein [Mycobacterium sp. 21AC1]|uniref:AraC family transcriptional regulator n=1 Tax=[Mycobacterium] appelbergii TaxID=2939269 RepID=UPI0029392377|nr:helix-turn-helix domain-containing protein [Mycobacterium sp. 21AC1]MDV3129268.1 helix-turn-helix domain-containing protein [Mycobacterium sp. 21AC1]